AKDVQDSLDFLLVKAKIRAASSSRQEALQYFDAGPATANGRIARGYGTAVVLRRARDFAAAEKEVNQLRARGPQHPMIESLAAGIKRDQGQQAAALDLYRAGLRLFPQYRSLVYGELETLIDQKNYNDALKAVNERLKSGQDEEKLYDLQSKIYAGLGKRLLQHQAQAEVYYRRGNLPAAADQLQIALRSGDGDFYQASSVEARLREIRTEIGPGKAGARDKP
ncbi:MAG: tetratricopeptide repeat protein, partial [Burkholderiales bacterium]|nr:tetratricopeptide repeat protein [Burkholderiales bacterium]